MKRLWWGALLVVALILVGCTEVTPGISPVGMPAVGDGAVDGVDVPTLPQFLEMLAGPTGWVVLGAFFSAVAAKWPWYNRQGDALKRGLILGGSAVVAIAARLLLTYMPASFWEKTEAYWYILGGIVLTWLGSQGWFRAVVKPARAAAMEQHGETPGI